MTATDFSAAMVDRGRRRIAAAGFDVDWHVADAARLPFPDASFDRATSVFGAIFAVDQPEVAAELVRVLRPGGSAGITAWTPDGLTARMIRSRRLALSEGGDGGDDDAPDPFRWGDTDHVAGLFAPTDAEVTTRRRTLTFRYPTWDVWRAATTAHGSAVVARQQMSPEAFDAMIASAEALTAEAARADGDDEMVFDSDHLEVVVRRR